jgi:outer membrane protein assembly factor BamB
VNPDDGTGKWTALLNAPSYRPVVGADGLYACSSNGYLSKLSLNTGAVVWVKTGLAFASSAPVLVAGGYLYVQTEDDRLYYLTQASGDSVWVCNCGDYLPHRRAIFPADISSPTVDTDGNVYVVGTEAVYKITANSPLDASVPWPKWQHDLYNTGYVRGGR